MDRLEGKKLRQETNPEKLPENVVLVDRPEARYHLLYEAHPYRGRHLEKEVEGLDAISAEIVDRLDANTPQHAGLQPTVLPRSEGGVDYGPAFVARLIDNNVPLYLTDVEDLEGGKNINYVSQLRHTLKNEEIDVATLAEVYVQIKGAMAIMSRSVSRRDLLKMGAVAPLILKGAVAPEPPLAAGNIKFSPYERTRSEIREMISPETEAIAITLRDAIWAYKFKTLVAPQTRDRVKRKPEIGMIVGAGHVGSERMLQKEPAELLELIGRILRATKNIFALLNMPKPDLRIAGAARYEFDRHTNHWEMKLRVSSDELNKIQAEYDS